MRARGHDATTPLPTLHGWSSGWSQIYRRWRRHVHDRREVAQLSDAALRDLGIARSELPSIEAESQPGALQTRRRVAAISVPRGPGGRGSG